ncbi:protein TALPID3 [Hippocampus comes]|uniref:protein TALPID3 n=1 Tax=Hippocampus comes TaxID=109280 RepID=UPI00094F2C2A|nr:PREDICTED: protein TALPID3 [Hippocampus comes]
MLQGRPPADDESYLTRLYGRAPRKGPTPGLRRSPPPRFNSTAPPVNRKPRPQAVEGAKGATMKGSQPKAAARRSSRLPSAESADLPVGPAEVPSPSVAIPLAHPRIGPSPRCRHNVSSPPVAFSLLAHAEAEHEPPTAGPPPVPTPDPPAPDPPSQPSPGPLEEDRDLAAESGAAADEGLQVQPDSPAGLEQEQAEPPDDRDARPAPSGAAESVARTSQDDPDEGGEIPGREFLSVADAGQEESAGDEGAFHQDGDPSPPPLVYRGPVRPAENRGAVSPPPRSSAPNLDDRTLDRMVQWLEQQLMARMIRGRSPPALPEQNEPSDAEEPSLASDVVEAAGGGGLQFFVDAGVQVDSPLVKELVNEVLSEMVDQALAPREPPVPGPAPDRGPRPGPNPGPGGPSSFRGETVPVVPAVPVVVTPLPTPLPSPAASIEEPLPLSTPAPSEATSLPMDDSPQPSVTAPPEPVATPIPSPEPSPPAEIPPSVHQVADAPSSGKASPPSDDKEEHLDTRSPPPEAQVEEAVRSPPRAPSPAAPPPQDDPKSPSAASDDSTSTGSSSNSSTVTGSETGLKLVSEGELLISFKHADATTEADTSSSSLQDEDLEPPSEGQVKVHMMEIAHTVQGERSLEEEELSSGEVSDSIAPQLDRKINHSGEAILEPTNGGVDLDLTSAASHMPASDLQSEPSQVLPFKRSSPQAGQPEVSIRTSAAPEKMSPSSEDSSDFF